MLFRIFHKNILNARAMNLANRGLGNKLNGSSAIKRLNWMLIFYLKKLYSQLFAFNLTLYLYDFFCMEKFNWIEFIITAIFFFFFCSLVYHNNKFVSEVECAIICVNLFFYINNTLIYLPLNWSHVPFLSIGLVWILPYWCTQSGPGFPLWAVWT